MKAPSSVSNSIIPPENRNGRASTAKYGRPWIAA